MTSNTVTIYSIGYQQKSVRELVELLTSSGVQQLIDVRERAWSNRPEFRKQRLKSELEASGIKYIHLKEAGNPFRQVAKGDWQICRGYFSEHISSQPGILDTLWGLLSLAPSAVFCYEARTEDCHRDVLLGALPVANTKVRIRHL